jgi:HD-like signal output (HDOD) protein
MAKVESAAAVSAQTSILSRFKRWYQQMTASRETLSPHQASPASQELHERFMASLASTAPAAFSLPQRLILQSLEYKLANEPLSLTEMPRLPIVVPKLLSALKDPGASYSEFSEIIRQDPSIASSVMRLANNVYYTGAGASVSSIERAVASLGVNGLRYLLAGAVMQPVIQVRSPLYAQYGKALWEHSLVCALVAEALAVDNEEDKFKSYLLGLLHEAGAIVLFGQLDAVFRENAQLTEPVPGLIQPLLHRYSMDLSWQVAQAWELPDDLVAAFAAQCGRGPMNSLAGVLRQANQLAELYALIQSKNIKAQEAAMYVAKLGLPENFFDRFGQLPM